MPPQKTTSSFASEMGNRLDGAMNELKDVPVQMGNVGLPGGIRNGVAQLSKCVVAKYADDVKNVDLKGKWYFLAMGVVKLPTHHEGQKVEGRHTKIGPEALCDTPKAGRKTIKEHLQWIRERLARLGLDVSTLNGAAGIEAACKALEKTKPHFSFHTFKGSKQVVVNKGGKFYVQNENGKGAVKGPYPTEEAAKKMNPYVGEEPSVFEDWDAPYDWDAQADTISADVVDSTGVDVDTPSANGEPATHDGDEAQYSDQEDLDGLIERAQASDQEAIDKLVQMVVGIGGTEEAVSGANSWDEVLEWLKAGEMPSTESEAEVSTESEPEPIDPWADLKKGDVVRYKPPVKGPGGKVTAGKKATDCSVVAINLPKRLCDLKNMTDKKTIYSAVSFDSLEVP